jgi:hypothetical protein
VEPASGTLEDATGDLRDQSGAPVAGYGYIDITMLTGAVAASDLVVQLTLAAAPPDLDASVDEITYLIILDTHGDDDPEYWIGLQNLSDAAYRPTMNDWVAGTAFDGDAFPGGAAVEGRLAAWRVPLGALGSPGRIRMSAVTQDVLAASGEVVAEDQLPDPAGGWRDRGAEWLVVLQD